MAGLIYTKSSSNRVRGARKQNSATIEAARLADEALNAKWVAMPKLAGKYDVKKVKKSKIKRPLILEPAVAVDVKPEKGKFSSGVGALPPKKTYTGDKVLGVTVLHKSCLQPVFSQEEAVDAAKMRR